LSGWNVRWLRHSEYADRTDRWTDGRTPYRYFTLSAKRNNKWRWYMWTVAAHSQDLYHVPTTKVGALSEAVVCPSVCLSHAVAHERCVYSNGYYRTLIGTRCCKWNRQVSVVIRPSKRWQMYLRPKNMSSISRKPSETEPWLILNVNRKS